MIGCDNESYFLFLLVFLSFSTTACRYEIWQRNPNYSKELPFSYSYLSCQRYFHNTKDRKKVKKSKTKILRIVLLIFLEDAVIPVSHSEDLCRAYDKAQLFYFTNGLLSL